MRKVEYVQGRAEGRICGLPYNTEVINGNGTEFHIWIGNRTMDVHLCARLTGVARAHRDVVRFTYCEGEPTGFWANEDISERGQGLEELST